MEGRFKKNPKAANAFYFMGTCKAVSLFKKLLGYVLCLDGAEESA